MWITADLDAEGLKQLQAAPDKIKHAAHNIAEYVLQVTRRAAPKKSGDLRRGIVLSPFVERTSLPGKAVYNVTFDEKMNDVFVKHSKSGKRYYYPASQEYGFHVNTRVNTRYVPGKYFMYAASRTSDDVAIAETEQLIDGIINQR